MNVCRLLPNASGMSVRFRRLTTIIVALARMLSGLLLKNLKQVTIMDIYIVINMNPQV